MEKAKNRILVAICTLLLTLALALVGAAKFIASSRDSANIMLFGSWTCVLLFLFVLGLSLPVQMHSGRIVRIGVNSLILVFAVGVTLLANIALYFHDVHFDLTREGSYTPPEQIRKVVKSLTQDVSFTYFYHDDDPQALHAKELLQVLARSSDHFHLRLIDPDSNPALARRYGVRFYNTAIVEADSHRATVENTTDLTQMAFAILRALRRQVKTVCFVVGNGEFFEPGGIKFHFTHAETLTAHDIEGGGDILEGSNSGFDRFYFALSNLGYELEQINLSQKADVPSRCAVVVDGGPRSAYTASESQALKDYLVKGGHLLLMYDPESPMEESFASVLDQLGIRLLSATVLDPTDHYGTDPEKVAVPYYTPHPVTQNVALTFFPGVRPIVLTQAPQWAKVEPLFVSTKDSYLREENVGLSGSSQSKVSLQSSAKTTGPRILAVAVTGRWPQSGNFGSEFRLIVVGDSDFATNAYFPSVSNGVLAISMVRWLAGDESTPSVKPETYSEPQVTLTNQQMRSIFILVDLVLPLGVALVGVFVWWRRR